MLDFAHYASLLCSAVLSDVLEGMGHSHQAMRPFIRPADESRVMTGCARPGLYEITCSTSEGENPYALEMELIDGLKQGEIAVLGCIGPLDSKGCGKMVKFDTPVCADVKVRRGDIVFSDIDGVVLIPQGIEASVPERAVLKVAAETATRRELLEGRLLTEVHEKYGVLRRETI